MKKIFLLPILVALSIYGCSINPQKSIEFPPVDTMNTTYGSTKILLSDARFMTSVPENSVKTYPTKEAGGQSKIEKRSGGASIILNENSQLVLKNYLEKTGRFSFDPVAVRASTKGRDFLTTSPFLIEAYLVSFDNKEHRNTGVAKAFGEPLTVTKTAVINLVLKDQAGNTLYIAEGAATINSGDLNLLKDVDLDDYVVNDALKNAINQLSRAYDQGHIDYRSK